MKGEISEQKFDIEWLEPKNWLPMVVDAVNIYQMHELSLNLLESERAKYLRGEESIIRDAEDYRKAIERKSYLEKVIKQDGWYVDSLVELMEELEHEDYRIVVDYLVDKELTQKELGDRYGKEYYTVRNKLQRIKAAIDGKEDYMRLSEGSLATIRKFIAVRGVL